MAIQIQFRNDTTANWYSSNPVLASGEMGIDSTTKQFKIGDGYTHWNDLYYGGIQGPTGASGGGGPIMIQDTFTAGNTITTGQAVYADSTGAVQAGVVGLAGGTVITSITEKLTPIGNTVYERVTWLDDSHFITSTSYENGTTYYLDVRCGSISGNTLTYGDAKNLTSGTSYFGSSGRYSIKAVSATCFAVLWASVSSYQSLCICTVTGTTITVGTPINLGAATSSYLSDSSLAVLDSSHIVVAWDLATTVPMYVCSISGTTPTAGTVSTLTGTTGFAMNSICSLDSSHYCLAYKSSSSTYSTCCSVSGTTITQGTPFQIADTAAANYSIRTTKLSSTTFVIVWQVSGYLKHCPCSVSGTTITPGGITTDTVTTTALVNVQGSGLYVFATSATTYAVFVPQNKYILACTIANNTVTSSYDITSLPDYFGKINNSMFVACKYITTSPYSMTIWPITISSLNMQAGAVSTICTGTGSNAVTSMWLEGNPSGTAMVQVWFASSFAAGWLNDAICYSVGTTGGNIAVGIAMAGATVSQSIAVAMQAETLNYFTGLTIGSIYYTDASGNKTTTPTTINGVSTKLGVALTATKILVNTARTNPLQLC